MEARDSSTAGSGKSRYRDGGQSSSTQGRSKEMPKDPKGPSRLRVILPRPQAKTIQLPLEQPVSTSTTETEEAPVQTARQKGKSRLASGKAKKDSQAADEKIVMRE